MTLKKTKLIATLALLIALALFIISLVFTHSGEKGSGYAFWLGMKAFSEAAMVGALADWFAVVALFRHPMGLPIPHTAIILTGKERVAQAIGEFFTENFLTASIIQDKITQKRPSYSLGIWLLQKRNAIKLVQSLSRFSPIVTQFIESKSIQAFIKETLTSTLKDIPLAQTASLALRNIKHTNIPESIVEKITHELQLFIGENKAMLEVQIGENIPLPSLGFLDKVFTDKLRPMLSTAIVKKLHLYFLHVSEDKDHPLREKIKSRLEGIADKLDSDPEYAESFEKAKSQFLESDSLDKMIIQIIKALKQGLIDQVLTMGTPRNHQITRIIRKIGLNLARHQDIQAQIDQFLINFISEVIHQYQPQIKNELESIVLNWDSQDMSDKIEAQIGPDLQFIRVNGTIVGGIIGLALFFLTYVIS